MMSENTKLQFYSETSAAWDAMYTDCLNAERSIEFEQYILMDDKAGYRFLTLFAQKAKQGVQIRLLLDAIGSRNIYFSSLVDDIRKAGGLVSFYNKITLFNLFMPWRWFPRNHNKTLLIDSKIGYVGSVCLAHEMNAWRDMHMRFEGELAKDIQDDFALVWSRIQAGKQPQSFRSQDRSKLLQYIAVRQARNPGRIYKTLLEQIKNSRQGICLVTPYFLPPWRLRHALRRAVRRGISVKIMISEKTDVKMADYVSRSFYPRLLKRGVRIFHFQKTVLHAKYAMIDNCWATIGSTNMDYLSLLHNHEANVMIADPVVVGQLYDQFEKDLQECVEIKMGYNNRITTPYRVLGFFGRGIKKLIQK